MGPHEYRVPLHNQTRSKQGGTGVGLTAEYFHLTNAQWTFLTGITAGGAANTLLGMNAAATALEYKTLTGTANRVTVSNGAGTITLSGPQDIHTAASPTFAGLTLSGLTANSFLYSGIAGLLTTTAAPINGQLLIGSFGAAPVAATITGTANRVTVANGAGTITLSGPQDIHTAASPTFAGMTLTGLTTGSVLFAGAGGLISQDNANIFWDNTLNRLGIGLTNPQQSIDSNGIVQARNSDTVADPTGDLGNGARFSLNSTTVNPFAIGIGAVDGTQYPMWFQTGDLNGGGFEWYIGTTERMRISRTGLLGIGVSPSAVLHLKAGTATANTGPLKFTSGTNLTTPENGVMEYNGTNLFFTRAGAVREGVLTQSAVTTEALVSDTSVTVNIGGTTYKLLARA